MRRRNCYALIFLGLLAVQSRAETACVDPALLARSTVSITRYFDDAERVSGTIGIQGTGWFRSPTTIITVEHVATAMGLSTEDWKLLKIGDSQSNFVRIQRLVGGRIERLAVLKLQTAVAAAQSVAIRTSPLAPEDRVVTLVSLDRNPRSVVGRFVQYVDDGRLAGGALLEVYEGENRFVIDHGASGAPVFDCEGRIAAVISTVITQIFRTPFGDKRISTAWGSPNVVSVPIHPLMVELSQAQ
jgi:Trypsin-like peptidase domain